MLNSIFILSEHLILSYMLYILLHYFFWVIPWRLNFLCQRFGTPCYMNMERTECSETTAHIFQKPENRSKERIKHS